MRNVFRISKIVMYDEPTVPEIQIGQIKKFIADTFSVNVESRKNFFQSLKNSQDATPERAFEEVASTRTFDLKKRFKKHVPTNTEIQSEKEGKDISKGKDAAMPGMYDGFELQKVVAEHLLPAEGGSDVLHIVFTNKLVCTFDEQDFRYHARALIGANPAIVSTSGIVEAPAKPRQYYIDMMTCFSEEEKYNISTKYEGKFLKHNDPQLVEVVKGYVLQAIVYYCTGEAFCTDKGCRLFNSHWQDELLYSQVENKGICKKHTDAIKKLREQI